MKMPSYYLLTFALAFLITQEVKTYDLTIIHTNDVHARIQQFNKYGTPCSAEDAQDGKCFGGVARRKTKVMDLRQSHNNTLFLDAGDQFLGTLWYTYYKGREASHFMNLLGYDVMVCYLFFFYLILLVRYVCDERLLDYINQIL